MAVGPRPADPLRLPGVFVPNRANAGGVAQAVERGAAAVSAVIDRRAEVDERVAEIDTRIAEREQQDADNRLSAIQSANLARMREELRVRFIEARNEAGGGADGLTDNMTREVDDRINQFNTIFAGNAEVQDRFAAAIAGLRAGVIADAQTATIAARARQRGNAFEETVATSANSASADGSPGALTSALTAVDTLAAAMSDLPAEQRDEALRAARQRIVQSWAGGLIERGGDQQIAALDSSGFFNSILEPGQLDNLRGRVGVAARAREVAAEQAASEARRSAREAMALMERRISAGELPSDAEIDRTIADARANGVPPADIYDLGVMRERAAANRQFAGANAEQLDRVADGVEAAVRAGTANAYQQRIAPHLRQLADDRQEQEIAEYRPRMQNSEGRLAVADALQALPPEQRMRRAEALEPGFGMTVMLSPQVRSRIERGRAMLRDNRSLLPERDAQMRFSASVGSALDLFPPEANSAVRQATDAIYVALFDGRPPGQIDRARYADALHLALGGTSRGGGLGHWRDGQMFILPPTMRQDVVAASIGRGDFAAARWGDGSVAQRADIMRSLHPVYAGENDRGWLYYMVDARGRRLQREGGGPFVTLVPR